MVKEFELNQITSFDRSVFEEAEVKSVLLLATKVKPNKTYPISFARVRNGINTDDLSSFVLYREEISPTDIVIREIQSLSLTAKQSWSAINKSTDLYELITKKQIICHFKDIANTQIGLETLAKDFFVVSVIDKEIVRR